MHYQSDITSYDERLWTRQELDRWLGSRFKGASPLFPDDEFYGGALSKNELLLLTDRIKKRLKIRQNVTLQLSRGIEQPGLCILEEKKLQITLPISVFGDPLTAAACIAHLLSHGLIMAEKRQLVDAQENERLADIACLQSGLGIIILNGLNKGGWRTKFRRESHKKSVALGYFTNAQFGQKLTEYLEIRSVDLDRISSFAVPWNRHLIGAYNVRKNEHLTKAVKRANILHKESLRWFMATIFLAFLTVGFLSFLALGRTTLLADQRLETLKQTASDLENTYSNCISRYKSLEETIPSDQISSARLLSYEQNRCKSLQNQYNSATQAHNDYLKSKK